MNRGTIIGATGGLIAGVSLATLALAAPSFALFGNNAASVAASAAGQFAAPMAAQQMRWGNYNNLADLVEKVTPSVVQIDVREPGQARMMSGRNGNPFAGTPFGEFFGLPDGVDPRNGGDVPDQRGTGSGFFIPGGYIVTNNHVAGNASKMTVILSDGRQLSGKLVGADAKTDLAVVKVEGKDLPQGLPWGDSVKARPGDSVFAMGSPFGLSGTVTSGIISARGRDIHSGSYDDFIQVDAPINQGNSGGPLFDTAGQVIGVNSAIYSPSGGNVGIGFSIPSEQARNVVEQIISHGSVQRGWLGVQIQPVTPEIASSLGLSTARGAMVNAVTAGGPADKGGIRDRDVILSFGDRPINHLQDLTRAVADTKAGTVKDVKILRDGREQTLRVNIQPLTDDDKTTKIADKSDAGDKPGQMKMSDLGLSLAAGDDGVVVASVKTNSPAEDAGIRVGDKLVMVNQTAVNSTDAAKKAVDEARKQKREAVLLQLQREDNKFFVGVPFSGG
ncbi:MAG TPA: Do family serine endopeptidase [Hyphomonadaceae bacterium]|nr:Do family serine endopeptidase [Hyphomonadaceae bacterium]